MPGITGARAAGMTVLGFHGGSHCRPGHADTLRAAGAAMTFDDMRQLPGLIGGLTLGRLTASVIPGWSETRPGISNSGSMLAHRPGMTSNAGFSPV